jgi:hypothetical protein
VSSGGDQVAPGTARGALIADAVPGLPDGPLGMAVWPRPDSAGGWDAACWRHPFPGR